MQWLFEASGFVPRQVCGDWSSLLVWVHVLSDGVIWASYMVIAVLMAGFIRKRHDRSLAHIFWLFGMFIVACGMTHATNAMMFWHPAYRLDGTVKLVCAAVSALTAALLVPLTPKIMRIPSVKKLGEQRTELRERLRTLEAQIAELAHSNPDLAERKLKTVTQTIQREIS